LTRLTLTVNAMLDRLQGTIEREQGFARVAAHELRTPLTSLAGRVELLLDEPQSAADYRRGLQQVQERVTALLTLSEDLLRLARTETPARLEPVELAGTVLEPAEDLRPQIRAAGKQLRLCLDESWVQAEPEGVRQIATNLLHNAVKYGGDEITLSVGPGELTVSDSGAGPDPADWARLVRPLERGRAEAGRGVAGSGLGLAVVAALAARWGASLSPVWTPSGFQLAVRWPPQTP
jgi:signal transduction histidine kinase